MDSGLSSGTLKRVDLMFTGEEREEAVRILLDVLEAYRNDRYPPGDRVYFSILKLGGGDVGELQNAATLAKTIGETP